MLINLKTQIIHKLFIHPIRYSLCRFSPEGLIEEIAPINNEPFKEEKYLYMIKKVDDNSVSKDSLKKLEGLSPNEYIHHENFTKTLKEPIKKKIIELLEKYLDIVATSSEQLTPSILNPHKIRLKLGAKPLKQKYYRLAKFKTDILKEELTKVIENDLIEISFSEWSSPVVLVPKHISA
ncbi:hypothetical protein BCR32DRAFT_249644 [Anaeromyces robustus]|uniref:Uncharacterized protein n=1 Tax=Anaeromyces robustus TaxID=1754192 RepID=A0A1Y1WPB0_9FUNG|nr:hypothetical protein BCR32DRAFT_249644 [Anaeromyces robustus]|eukprot:ORX75322.1 hypothetical protein BCR32DRAFT_249644 [Anaeromyces robustus]